MKRRQFVTSLGIAMVLPLPAQAQQSGKVYRVAVLSGGSATSRADLIAAFMARMRDLGYVDGANLLVEHRFANNNFERLPQLMSELLAWGPDVLFVSTTPASLAAKTATSTVPIVMVAVADPVGVGLVASLARPGGNITGITNIAAELAGKRLEILKEIVPAARRVAILINPDDPNAQRQIESAKSAARPLGIELDPVLNIRSRQDLESVFAAAGRSGADAALRMIDPTVSDLRKPTVELAARYKLPVIYAFREDVIAGGLVSYGTSLSDQYRQAATLVDKILGGASPADLPVEQPTKFEFAVNLRTAKALAIVFPPSLLTLADEVIE
jgi:putative tryptophan/tyrosine transport system substrate-binding protein